MIYSHHDEVSQDYPGIAAKGELIDFIIVARVRPRTSKGITDLLLPKASVVLKYHCPTMIHRGVPISWF